MSILPLVVNELRMLFNDGATPTALVKRIADRHPDATRIDTLVREYFREAFHVPMALIGPEQVREIAAGNRLPSLNVSIVHRIIQTRAEWDRSPDPDGGWLDGVEASDEAALIAGTDPASLPELSGSWERLDDEAKRFIRRIIGSSRSMHERVVALAALAERLQQKQAEVETRRAQGA